MGSSWRKRYVASLRAEKCPWHGGFLFPQWTKSHPSIFFPYWINSLSHPSIFFLAELNSLSSLCLSPQHGFDVFSALSLPSTGLMYSMPSLFPAWVWCIQCPLSPPLTPARVWCIQCPLSPPLSPARVWCIQCPLSLSLSPQHGFDVFNALSPPLPSTGLMYSMPSLSPSLPSTGLMYSMPSLPLSPQHGFDVFNALDLMENKLVLEKLKFGIGDGNLQYYLYNWRCPPLEPNQVCWLIRIKPLIQYIRPKYRISTNLVVFTTGIMFHENLRTSQIKPRKDSANISFTSILYPQFTHMIFIIYTSHNSLHITDINWTRTWPASGEAS